jgi:hypothetical protein
MAGSATPMRGKSLTYRTLHRFFLGVFDLRSETIKSRKALFRQVPDLPRIGVAEPFPQKAEARRSERAGFELLNDCRVDTA